MSGGPLSRDALANMSAEEIVKARRDGRLGELLAGNDPGREGEPFTPPEIEGIDQGARGRTYSNASEWLKSLSPDQVVAAHKAGHLDAILQGEVGHP